MNRICFFPDDTELFRRIHLERKTTPMTECAEYTDGMTNPTIPRPFVIREPEGLYRMIYPGNFPSDRTLHYFSAISEDGIHFRPDTESAARSGIQNPAASHQYMPDLPPSSELFDIFEDPFAEPEARYKMLVTIFSGDKLCLNDSLRISPDGRNWKELPTVRWHSRGTEPPGCVAADPHHPGSYLILTRPDWGDRRVALIRTGDWENFTAPQLVMAPDSLDEPMAEHYGLCSVYPCGGMLFGLLLIYRVTDKESLAHKFMGGKICCELVYSRNGEFWQRTTRKPFIGAEHTMFWPSTIRCEGENLFLYANVTSFEHGNFYPEKLCSSIRIYRTPKDRFISLAVEAGAEYGALALRQCVLRSGELHWNLRAEQATCAIYEQRDNQNIVLRSHEDCIPFSGDSTDWSVRWKSHDSLNDLYGKLLVFELKMRSGEVWSCSGDFNRLGTTEGFRYDRFQILPTRHGF